MLPLARLVAGVAGVLVSTACGGADPVPATTQTAGGAAGAVQVANDTAQTTESVGLVREVFDFSGSGRDPFRSLVEGDAGLRPFIEDLRVTSIIFDARYPARSVAVLRDIDAGARYEVRAGDELGRLKVTEIREEEVVIATVGFGRSRQVVLPIRERQEDNS